MSTAREAASAEAMRRQVLDAILAEVPFEGLNARTLAAACRSLDLDPVEAEITFPGGVTEVIDYWCGVCDQAVLDAMAGPEIADLKVRQRIAFGVRTRLMAAAEHREAVRRALVGGRRPVDRLELLFQARVAGRGLFQHAAVLARR
jgi:ubiquinone biosynthesis protein COQ9